MNYYISGISGFTGAAFATYLKERGESVFGIPRTMTMKDLICYFDDNEPDYIINLSTYGNHYYQTDISEMAQSNIINTYNILEALRHFDYIRFYHVSTSSVKFGVPTLYSITKQCGEQVAAMYPRVTISRPYSIYGEGEALHRFIPTVIASLKSGREMILDETATHDWIYIEDCIRAILDGKTEIGRGVAVTNLEVVRMLEEISGMKLNYLSGSFRTDGIDNWKADVGVYGINLFEGLKRVYDKFKW